MGREVPALPSDFLFREPQQVKDVAREVLFAPGVIHDDLIPEKYDEKARCDQSLRREYVRP